MEINQYNYEHYFLMYIDNELSGEERAAVNDFIMQHPNYANKLQELQQLKISPDNITYENKFSLYKLSRQDDQCINYLDNEMPLLEKSAFEKSLTYNSLLRAALNDWKRTILTKEAATEIDPAFKKSLYKKEAIVKPIWSSIAVKQWASVAALLLLVISVSIYQQNDSKNKLKSIVQLRKDAIQKSSQLSANDIKPSQTNVIITKDRNKSKNYIILGSAHLPTNHELVKNSYEYQVNILQNKVTKNIPLQITQNEIPLEKINNTDHNDISANSQVHQTESNHTLTTTESYTLTSKASISDAQDEISNIIPTADLDQIQYINIDTDEEGRSINIANLEIDGAKFRALSRKITTLFRTNKPENDKYK